MSHRALNPEQFQHQILADPEFSNVADLPEEKSITSPDPQNIIPEKEDEDIGEKPN